MAHYRKGSHTVYGIKYYFVWVTKYRYRILQGDVALRLRELLRQECEANYLKILKGSAGPDHVHIKSSISRAKTISFLLWLYRPYSSAIIWRTSSRSIRLILSSIVSVLVSLKCAQTR